MNKVLKPFYFKAAALRIFPYILFLGLSFIALYVYFYGGVLIGDDLHFHLANISDEYLSLLNEGSIPRISTYLASNLGVGNRLFYSPLFHFLSALVYFVTHGLGGNAVTAIKVVMFISVFVSGVFMYRFVLKVTGRQSAATLAASLYIIYPYRIFDALCRAAFAEALAMTFLPLFFMGLYGLVNFNDEIKVGPFIATIIGGASLFLSHNLTAMFGFIFGVIYLLANAKKVVLLCRKRRYWITGLISLAILVGLMAIQLFTTFELLDTGLYVISDRSRMWTTLDFVIGRTETAFNYSGFLNFPYMNGNYPLTMSQIILLTQIICFALFSILFVVADKGLQHFKRLKYFHFAISALIYLAMMMVFSNRLEVMMAALIVVVLYFFIDYIATQKNDKRLSVPIYKEVDFWFLIGIIVLNFALITQKWIWMILPDPLLMIQFPWRLWAFIQFFAAWMIGWLVAKFHHRKAIPIAAAIAIGFCLVTNQALPEKRLLRERIDDGESTAVIYDGMGDYLAYNASIGWNKEYVPQVFVQSGYVSEYANSLYEVVRLRLRMPFVDEYPLDPVVLSGDCAIEVTARLTPNCELTVAVADESLIQMPLIYYPGYQIEVVDEEGNKRQESSFDVDGLVGFNVNYGDKKIMVSYVGTPLAISSYVIFGLAVAGVAALLAFYYFSPDKKKQKPII
ncbi:MAG: hypothetical protein WC344_01180 [Bacilli bacterium]|jgi:hypothetical protein